MEKKQKLISEKNSVGRLMFAVISVLLQIGWVFLLMTKLNAYSTWMDLIIRIIALGIALYILGNQTNPSFKMSWIIIILGVPVFGLCVFVLFGHSSSTRRMKKKYEKVENRLASWMSPNERLIAKLEEENMVVAGQAKYLARRMRYPLYENCDVRFFGDTKEAFEAQIEAVKNAKNFIFMEYFAMEDSEAFGRLKAELVKKVKEGVEVRILYDDVGSISFVNPEFQKNLVKQGIQCRIFNKVIPVFRMFLNNRDHRKIMVIDGQIGFTGGYNIADEYFNIVHPYGQWKDSGVCIQGAAVRSLTAMFLEMWNATKKADKQFERYFPTPQTVVEGNGYVQPYADSPLDGEYVGENVYLNMIHSAQKTLYITTPYIIISDEMVRQLGLAARRGVDVRIIAPAIPDKEFIFKITQSYYPSLVKNGVRIYRYTPGFIHAKQFLVDGIAATVGTVNMDFRSFSHHFENGVYMYGCDAVRQIQKDFEELFEVCEELTEKYKGKHKHFLSLYQCMMRLLAPLL